MSDVSAANKRYGIFSLPSVVHFEHSQPNVYTGEMKSKALMNWLQDQKSSSYIERVTPELLQTLLKKEEYVATLFLNNCDRDVEECERVLGKLEVVNDSNAFTQDFV